MNECSSLVEDVKKLSVCQVFEVEAVSANSEGPFNYPCEKIIKGENFDLNNYVTLHYYTSF